MYRSLILSLIPLLACWFLTLARAQETETTPSTSIYESVIFPDRSLSRRLEQVDRLFETGRTNESAQLLGGILENTEAVFFQPEESDNEPARTLHLTINDYIITRFRNLPKEARESYAFQFEPTARRLLDNAVTAGALDDVQQVARKYFPTPSGASATFLVALTQYERGDYAAAFLTLERLKRLHPAIPEALTPALEKMHEELQNRLQAIADPPQQTLSESAWLEQIGWRLPAGSPSQNAGTNATAPLLEQNWTVPIFSRLFQERETDAISRSLEKGSEVYLPAAQPLLVGDSLITRTFGETIAVDTNTGKRLWVVSESEYRFPSTVTAPLLHSGSSNTRAALRLFFWHNRVAQQLSSDGERLFCVDGHDFQVDLRQFARIPQLAGKGEDLRYYPGSTLTARDVKTGRILWQVGKFPYVQKYIDALFALPRGQQSVDETIFTADEKNLKETWFLGAPLPLHGRLYVIGETDGVLQLFVLESQTGNIITQQAFAHVQPSIALNLLRRAYPLFPSASGGIVICPTGNGLVTALDATTLVPIWCFSYVTEQAAPDGNRRMQNPRLGMQIMNINENNFRYLFTEGGWQFPRMIIDGQRVLVAPPDSAALYCLDLLSGKLLWEHTVERSDALYVACVYDDKVFAVTPANLLVFNMNTGEEIAAHQSRFPSSLRPAGVGVHSGNQYFIPFTEGLLAVADLDNAKLIWLDASGLAKILPSGDEMPTAETAEEPMTATLGTIFSGQRGNELEIFTPDLAADDIFQRPIRLGNLVGIKGRFFSQSPTQIASFDQKEPLRQRTETLLQADPNNPEGLLHQGRLLKSEGKLAEAINSFRASWRSQPTPEAADALRRNLLDAMRNDYSAWADAGQELESLAEFPDERGIIFYAQMEGILQSGTPDDLASVLERVFTFGHAPTILIPVSSDYSVQLHRALGGLIDQSIFKGDRRAWRAAWEEIAETFFQRLTEQSTGNALPPQSSALVSQWFRDTVYLPHNIQRWSTFAHIFRNTGAAKKANQILRDEYERYRLPVALDLQEKTSTPKEWSELCVPFVWKPGVVKEEYTTSATNNAQSKQDAADKSDIDQNISRLLNIARNPNISAQFTGNQQAIPFLGSPDSELAMYSYVIGSWTSGAAEFFLYCNDPAGQELWRLALPSARYMETRGVNTHIGEQVLYVKGWQNFLLLVLGDSMTAIDVSQQSKAKIIWSKTLSSILVSQQSSKSRNPDQRIAPINEGFPKKSVHVSPQVIAVWDSSVVYGLEPLTGQTLWVRKVTHEKCSILGDDENLFLVFPDAKRIIAVDPTSGKELADCPLPVGTSYFVYGRNLVFTQRTRANSDQYAFYICDLLDIHNKRDRALNPTSALPMEKLFDRLPQNVTLVQMLYGDRFLSVAHWGTKMLQVYDLQTKKKLLPDENVLLQFVSEGITGTMRCDVEFVEDRILVLFTKDINMRPIQDSVQGTDVMTRQLFFSPVTGVQGMSIGKGEMMLFDTLGKPCWSASTKIETTCRLLDVPDCLPVKLFSVSVQTRESLNSSNTNTYTTRIMGVDKRTGEFRFRKEIESVRQSLQMFRVLVSAEEQSITFTTLHPPETLRVCFTDAIESRESGVEYRNVE